MQRFRFSGFCRWSVKSRVPCLKYVFRCGSVLMLRSNVMLASKRKTRLIHSLFLLSELLEDNRSLTYEITQSKMFKQNRCFFHLQRSYIN